LAAARAGLLVDPAVRLAPQGMDAPTGDRRGRDVDLALDLGRVEAPAGELHGRGGDLVELVQDQNVGRERQERRRGPATAQVEVARADLLERHGVELAL